MSETQKKEVALPHFHLTDLFPDAKGLLSTESAPLNDAKRNAIFVLDTNVLLLPYSTNPKALDEILKAYKQLAADGRLFVPAQVMREFARLRPDKIKELYQKLSKHRSYSSPATTRSTLLESLPELAEVAKIELEIHQKNLEYQKAISTVLNTIKAWRWNDPVSSGYREVFSTAMIVETLCPNDNVISDLKRRIIGKVPPGYKDSGKEDEGIGDVIIWHTILELGRVQKKDLVFVTGEEKADWWHRSDGIGLYPRFELADEYRRESGARFNIMKFSDLLNLFGAPDDVVREIKDEETNSSQDVDGSVGFSGERSPEDSRDNAYLNHVRAWIYKNWSGVAIREGKSNFRIRLNDQSRLQIFLLDGRWIEHFRRHAPALIAHSTTDIIGLLVRDDKMDKDTVQDLAKSALGLSPKVAFAIICALSFNGESLVFAVNDAESSRWLKGYDGESHG